MAEVVSRRSIIYDVLFNTKKGKAQIKGAEKSVKKLDKTTSNFNDTLKKVGVAIAGAFAVQQLATFAKQLVTTAVQLEAFERRAKIVFGNSLKFVQDFAKGNAISLGLSTQAFIGAAAAIGDLIVPLGLSRRRAAEMSTELVKLGGALKQFTGDQRSAAEISNIVGRALTGEVEALKPLGITISQNSKEFKNLVEQKMRDEGVTQQQAKALAIYQQALEKSSDAMQSFETDSESLTRQSAELNAQLEEINNNLAQALVPSLTKLTKILSGGTKNIRDFGIFGFGAVKMAKALGQELTKLDVAALSAGERTENLSNILRDFAIFSEESTKELGDLAVELANLASQKSGDAIFDAIIKGKLQDKLKTTQAAMKNFTDAGSTDIFELERAIFLITQAIEDFDKEVLDSTESLEDNTKAIEDNIEALTEWNFLHDLSIKGLQDRIDKLKEIRDLDVDIAPAVEAPTTLRDDAKKKQDKELEIKEALKQAELELTEAKLAGAQAGIAIAQGFVEESAGLQTALLVLQKGLAIADITINLQKEISAIAVAGQILGPVASIPYIASRTAAAGIRAAVGIGVVAATTIPELAFAEGTDFLSLSGNKKGRDTIPIWADEGEAIIKADSNKAYPGLARAFIDRNVEDWIGLNYLPKLETIAGDSELIDYSNRFYNQLRATKSSNLFLRDIRDAVMNKNDTRTLKLMNRRRF